MPCAITAVGAETIKRYFITQKEPDTLVHTSHHHYCQDLNNSTGILWNTKWKTTSPLLPGFKQQHRNSVKHKVKNNFTTTAGFKQQHRNSVKHKVKNNFPATTNKLRCKKRVCVCVCVCLWRPTRHTSTNGSNQCPTLFLVLQGLTHHLRLKVKQITHNIISGPVYWHKNIHTHAHPDANHGYTCARLVVVVVVVVFFSLCAHIWGECLTIHSPPAHLKKFFFSGE